MRILHISDFLCKNLKEKQKKATLGKLIIYFKQIIYLLKKFIHVVESEMTVLEEEPASVGERLLKKPSCVDLLTLTHGNWSTC